MNEFGAFLVGLVVATVVYVWVHALDAMYRFGLSQALRGIVSLLMFLAMLAAVVYLDMRADGFFL